MDFQRHFSLNMKYTFTLLLIAFSFISFSQAPQRINYQGAARNAAGIPMANKTIKIRFELLQNSATVFTEDQSLTTNLLGLFTTRIGDVNTSGLALVNWEAGAVSLKLGIDTANGTNFIDLGTQPLVSAPYAMHAQSVPSTYTNNVLTIGNKSYTMNAAGSGSVDIQAGTNVNVTGTSPNYTISSTPTLNMLAPGTLSISGCNTVDITPTLSLSGSNLSAGSSGNSVNIAPVLTPSGAVSINGTFPNYTIYATPAGSVTVQNATITGSGIATVTSTLTNLYNVNVPSPTLSAISNSITITQGTAVSTVTVPVSPSATLTPQGIANISNPNTNSFVVNVPSPTVTTSGNSITVSQGTAVSTATIASTPNTTLTPGGVASITNPSTNSFVVNVPSPTLTSSSNSITITQGTAVSTVTVPVSPSATLTPQGVANITNPSTNSFVVNVPSPTVTTSGNSITVSQGTAVSTATIASTPNTTLTPSGLANITNPSTNSFVVGVPDPTVTVNSNSITVSQGTAVSTATIATTPNTTLTPGGVANITNPSTNSFVVNVPSPTVTVSSNSITVSQGTAVSTATIATTPNTTLTPGGVANITNPSTNSFVVNVPSPTVTVSSNSITVSQGTAVSTATIATTPNTTVTPSGLASVTNPSTNSFVVGVPDPTVTVNSNSITISQGTAVTTATYATTSLALTNNNASAASIGGSSPSYTINVPTVSVAAAGLASVTNTLSAFTVSVPVPSYNAASGQLISGTNSLNITPTLALSGSTLTVGPASNTVNLSGISPFFVVGNAIVQTSTGYSVGVGTTAPSAKLEIAETSTYTGVDLKVQNTNSVNASNLAEFTSNGTGSAVYAVNSNTSTTAYAGYFDGGLYTKGKTTGTSGFAINALDLSTNPLFVVRNDGNVGIGTNAPSARLNIINASSGFDGLGIDVTNTSNGGNATQVRHYGLGNAGYFEYNNASNNGHALVITSNSGSQYTLRSLNTSTTLTAYAGMFEGGLIARGKNSSNTGFAFKAQETGGSDLFTVRNDGNVGIRNSTPAYDLSIFNGGTYSSMQMRNGTSAGLGFVIGQNNTNVSLLNYENTPMYFGTNGANRMMIDATGSVAIGGVSPAAKLDITGNVKIADGTQGTGKILTSDANGLATWQMIVPPGAVMAFAGASTNIPSGWVICDGSQVSRTGATANLFAAIGTAWGIGDGSTTFNLPDMRGNFLRGVDQTANNDPDKGLRLATNGGNSGNNVGSKQDDQLESHNHTVSNLGNTVSGALLGTSMYVPGGSTTTSSTGGNETRPKNVYVFYIIKL